MGNQLVEKWRSLYLENLAGKARVSLRRKQKFTPVARVFYSGNEDRWNWSRSKPGIVSGAIRTYKDLVLALQAIAAGDSNHDCYHGVSGLDRERLRTAQSLRDRGVAFEISEVARAGYTELEERYGCPKMRRTSRPRFQNIAREEPKSEWRGWGLY